MLLQRRRCAASAAIMAAALLLAAAPRQAAACTSYIVGRQASEGGVTVIARNDDGDGATSPTSLVHHRRREHPAAFRSNLNHFAITLPAPGLAYFALPDGPLADATAARNTSGEAAGWNEAGVAVSATESIYNSAAALAAGEAGRCRGLLARLGCLLALTVVDRSSAALTAAVLPSGGPPSPTLVPCSPTARRPPQRGQWRD